MSRSDSEYEDARERALIAALAGLIRSCEAGPKLEADAAATLAAVRDAAGAGLEARDREAILAMGHRRVLAYRSLVHNRIRNVISRFLPRSRAQLGARFREEVAAFVDELGVRSPYLREVPVEFLAWAGPRWRAEGRPALEELARYELLEQVLANDPRPCGEPTGAPLALDRAVALNPTLRCARFTFAVEADPPDRAQARAFLACRDTHHRVHRIPLSELRARLLEALLAGRPLAEAVRVAARQPRGQIPDATLEDATYALGEWTELGAVLGAAP